MLQVPLIHLTGGAVMLILAIVTFATGGAAIVGWLALGSAVLLAVFGIVSLLDYLRV